MDQLLESEEVLQLQKRVEKETNEHWHSWKNTDVENRLNQDIEEHEGKKL